METAIVTILTLLLLVAAGVAVWYKRAYDTASDASTAADDRQRAEEAQRAARDAAARQEVLDAIARAKKLAEADRRRVLLDLLARVRGVR